MIRWISSPKELLALLDFIRVCPLFSYLHCPTLSPLADQHTGLESGPIVMSLSQGIFIALLISELISALGKGKKNQNAHTACTPSYVYLVSSAFPISLSFQQGERDLILCNLIHTSSPTAAEAWCWLLSKHSPIPQGLCIACLAEPHQITFKSHSDKRKIGMCPFCTRLFYLFASNRIYRPKEFQFLQNCFLFPFAIWVKSYHWALLNLL